MSKANINAKATRVLKFILGGRHPAVHEAMAAFGYSDAERRQGLALLEAVTRTKWDARVPQQGQAETQLIDQAENVWFPIARGALKMRFPEAYDYLFHNLGQTSGPAVVLTAGTFFARLCELGSGKSPVGRQGVKARALLAQRGLTDEVIAETEALIEQLARKKDRPAYFASQAEQKEAEDAMWAWYLDWSAVARVAVKDRRLLRSLGFLSNTRRSEDEAAEEVDALDPTEPDGVPSPLRSAAAAATRSASQGREVSDLN